MSLAEARKAADVQRRIRAEGRDPKLALRLCVLTATRTSETRLARWREVDPIAREWTIPQDRMKAGKEHTVPRSEAAFEILMSLHTEGAESGDYIFCGPSGRPFAEDAMLRIAQQLRPNTKLTVHGFPDRCGDETDTPREVAESALAHTIGGVEGAYRRATALAKRRTLMEAWGGRAVPEARLTRLSSRARYAEPSAGCDQPRRDWE